eukprot:2790578-Rhodomonas_salina.9
MQTKDDSVIRKGALAARGGKGSARSFSPRAAKIDIDAATAGEYSPWGREPSRGEPSGAGLFKLARAETSLGIGMRERSSQFGGGNSQDLNRSNLNSVARSPVGQGMGKVYAAEWEHARGSQLGADHASYDDGLDMRDYPSKAATEAALSRLVPSKIQEADRIDDSLKGNTRSNVDGAKRALGRNSETRTARVVRSRSATWTDGIRSRTSPSLNRSSQRSRKLSQGQMGAGVLGTIAFLSQEIPVPQ